MATQRHVAILISTVGAHERAILRGIGSYARHSQHWVCQFQQPSAENIERVKAYRPDGIIAAVWDALWVPALQALQTRVVNVADVLSEVPFPSVRQDSRKIGEMAVEYLVNRGFEHLAFVGLKDEHFSLVRAEAFARAASRSGPTCSVLQLLSPSKGTGYGWREQDADLIRWLGTLHRPVGILASNDGRAVQLIEAAKQIGLSIPHDIAAIGVDNDEVICNLARPPISSIELAGERVGFLAAKLLDDLLDGRVAGPVAPVAPVGIVTRESSDVLAISDPDLSCAIKYIRDNAHRPLRADEVADQVAIARRSLERRFVSTLGRTILDEIHRAHVEQAKQLLTHTDLPMPAIAERSGFGGIRHLPIVFRRLTGFTPGSYRKQFRLRD